MSRNRSRRRLAALAAVTLTSGLAVPATGLGALTATGVALSGRPAYEQVVVTFSGGTLSGLARQVDALDPAIGDGRAVVRVNGRGITAAPVSATRGGVRAPAGPAARQHPGAAGRAARPLQVRLVRGRRRRTGTWWSASGAPPPPPPRGSWTTAACV